RSGEASGQFAESADRMADLLENEVARRSLVISALIYPAVLSGVAVIVVIFLLTFVVPRLSSVFAGMGENLPTTTKILLATTGFITGNAVPLIIAIVVGIVFLRGYIATPVGALAKDRLLLNLPMGGVLIKKGVISRYARVLGTLVNGGVPILEALELAGKAAGNRVFSEVSNDV